MALLAKKQAVLPFTLMRIPVKKLALVNIESNPDTIYRAFELQYLDGEPYGKGYRVLAYRLDHYVDIYDSNELKVVMNEHFNAVENGMGEYQRVDLEHTVLEYGQDGFSMHFEFKDKLGRSIEIHIKEHTGRKTKPMRLLAPLGAGSKRPDVFPLYLMYQFDFVRNHKTMIRILIDGKNLTPDKFPFPGLKNGQRRNFVRYSMDSVLLELAETQRDIIERIPLSEENTYTEGNTTYYFEEKDGEMGLSYIIYRENEHEMRVLFDRGLYLVGEYNMYVQGQLSISGIPDVGTVLGTYEYKRTKKRTILRMWPKEGWFPPKEGMLARFMLGKQSIFRTWPQTYRYTQAIEWDSMQSRSQWNRIQ